MRPFEIGDLVILKNKSTGTITNVKHEYKKGVGLYYPDNHLCINAQCGWRHYCFDDVKTIRKPRKGSKEARDIVAMLALNYLYSLEELKTVDYVAYSLFKDNSCKMSGIINNNSKTKLIIAKCDLYYRLYKQAKEMLR